MNTGDVIQIEAPEFDPNIDEALPTPADQNIDHQETQGSVNSVQQFSKKTAKCKTPASAHQDAQDIDWLDMIPVEILPQPDQNIEQNITTLPTRYGIDQAEIPQLETDPKEEQSQDRARLLDLEDNRYYQEIDHAYQTYGPLPAQDYIPANQAPGPRRMTQELM